jgi:hypothetical protein
MVKVGWVQKERSERSMWGGMECKREGSEWDAEGRGCRCKLQSKASKEGGWEGENESGMTRLVVFGGESGVPSVGVVAVLSWANEWQRMATNGNDGQAESWLRQLRIFVQ